MDMIKLCLVFLVIILILWIKKPLAMAVISGIATAILLYGIPIDKAALLTGKAVVDWGTISVVLSFYEVTFLQRMLEKRRRLRGARESLDGIFNNRRINASLTPAVIGLLPSAGAMNICGAMVNSACGDYLGAEDKAFVTSFFRHIPESFLPTFSSILIGLTLSGVGVSAFVVAMLPMVSALFILGYLFYLRKIPKGVERAGTEAAGRMAETQKFFRSLWSIILVVALIIILDMPVYLVTPLVILINFFVDRFSVKEVLPMFYTAIEAPILYNTVLVMIFKDIVTSTGVIHRLPETFSVLPVPAFLVFVLIFFVGTIVSGSNAIIALCMPMAMAAVPGAGLPLVIALMCSSYAAMQISPTHICLFVATEYFKVPISALIRRTVPVIACFMAVAVGYSLILSMFF